MEHLLISATGVAYGSGITTGAWDIGSLADGALAMFEKDGTLVDSAIPVVTNDSVYMALGRTGLMPLLSPMIDRTSLRYNKQVYIAPVARRSFVGFTGAVGNLQSLNLPATLSVGDRISITLVDRDLAHEVTKRTKTYDVTASSGDLLTGNTTVNIVNRLITLVNADPNKFATLTAVLTTVLNVTNVAGIQVDSTAGRNIGINLDSKTSFNSISGTAIMNNVIGDADITEGISTTTGGTTALINGVFYSASTTVTLATVSGNATTVAYDYSKGEGTATQMTALELAFSTRLGNINAPHMTSGLFTNSTRVVVGATYTQYNLEWKMPKSNKLADNQDNVTQQLIIAVPSGDAAIILALDTILAAL